MILVSVSVNSFSSGSILNVGPLRVDVVNLQVHLPRKPQKPTIHVGNYTSPMDRQGRIDSRSANKNMSSQKNTNVCCLGFSCSLEVCKMHRGTQEGVFGRQANAERLQQVFGQAFGQQQRSQRDDLCP